MTTTSFWVEDVGLETRPPLAGDAECDLVVIGSGIAGLSSAYEAARFGWRVILIERHPCRLHRPLEWPREVLGLPVPWLAIPA